MLSTFGSFTSTIAKSFNSEPQIPTNLAVVSTTSSSVTLSFSPPIVTTGITGYIATTTTGAQGSNTSSPITISGLGAGTTYTITIVTVNLTGISKPSSSINATTLAGYLFTNDGSNLTGWTNGSPACLISSSIGYPIQSIQVSGNRAYAYYNLGYSFLNTTITFDVYVGSLCDFYFACNSGGAGQMFRSEGRFAGSGFQPTSSWTSWSSPQGGIQFISGTWYSVKIMISSSGVATWYRNNVLQSQTRTISNNGTYFGLQGDGGGGTSYYDNILIVSNTSGVGGTTTATNTGVPVQPVVTSIVPNATGATINYTAPINVTTGSNYYLLSGTTTVATSAYPATVVTISNLIPNTTYNYYLIASNAFGNSIVRSIISHLTLPINPVVEVVTTSATTTVLNLVNFGSNSSVSNSLSVVPSPSGVSINKNGSLFTVSGLTSNSNYFIGTVTSNAAGYANNGLGQITNTSPLITVASGPSLPAISAYGQYVCLGCYGNGIYVSTNYGATFTKIVTEANAAHSAISDSGKYMFVACNNVGRLYWSSNYGTSFTLVTLGSNISCITCSVLGNTVYACDATIGGIYYSTNYGVTWSAIVLVGANLTAIKANVTGTIAYVTSTTTGKAYSYNLYSNNVTIYSPGGSTNVSGIAFSADSQYIYVCNSGGLCYSSVNSGVSFVALSLASSGYAGILCDTTGKYVYVHNSSTTVYYSADYGSTFTSITLLSASSLISLNSNGSYMCISSGSGLYISTNRLLITTSPLPPTNLIDISNTSSTALIQFSPPQGNVSISGYVASTTPTGGVGLGTATAYTIYDLSASTSYAVSVAAINSGGTSAYSEPVTVVTTTASGDSFSSFPLNTTPNLVLYYRFDTTDVNGTLLANITNSGLLNYGATMVGTTTVTTTKYKLGSGSLYFSNAAPGSTTQYVTLPSVNLTSTNMTFAMWAYIPNVYAIGQTFVEIGNGSGSDHIRLWYGATNTISTTINSQDTSITTFTVGVWFHLAWVLNGSSWTIYINGASVYNATRYVPPIGVKNSNNLGRSPAYGNSNMYGYLDDFRFYKTNLTASDIFSIYSSNPYVAPPPFMTNANFSLPLQTTNSYTYYANGGFAKSFGYNYTSVPGWNINYANGAVAVANGSNAFFTVALPTGNTQAFVFQISGTYGTQPYCVLSQNLCFTVSGDYLLNFSTIPRAATDPSYMSLTAILGGYSTSTTLLNSTTAWKNTIMPVTIASTGNYNLLFYFASPAAYINTAIGSSISLTNVSISAAFNPPTNLAVSSATTTGSILNFTPAQTSGISATSYTSTIGSGSGTPTAYSITGLIPNTIYNIGIVANYPAGFYYTGNSFSGSSFASRTLVVLTVPSAPTLAFVSATIDSATVTIATTGTGQITGYNLTTVPTTLVGVSGSGSGTAYLIVGLVSNTIYNLSISSINSAGTSSAGALTVTTVPLPPTSVVGTVVSDTNVSVAFTPPTGNGSISQYRVTSSPDAIISTGTSSPITVTGLAANTSYTFTVTATNMGGTSAPSDPSSPVTTNLVPNPPTNLVVVSTTSTSATISFTPPQGTVVGYIASTSSGSQGTSTGSPITITGLGASTTYYISIVTVNYNGISVQSSTISATTLGLTSPLTIPNLQVGDITGTSISGGSTYNVYVFKATGITYTLNYTFGAGSQMYVLAVGGGGGGGSFGAGGAGAGGVVMTTVSLPSGSNSISVTVGSGGTGAPVNSGSGGQGVNTTLVFNANSALNITAGGGCGGCARSPPTYTQFGSGGGGGASGGACNPTNGNTNGGLVYANNGSPHDASNRIGGGGGGAGTAGGTASSGGLVAAGGDGLQCTLNGISTFTPSGTAYGTYYWGGGGGASAVGNNAGNGGKGGGGGGVFESSGTAGLGDKTGINPGGDAQNVSNGSPGAGGVNTGGGGGSNWVNTAGGTGGSGIVIIAYTGGSGSSSSTNTGVPGQPILTGTTSTVSTVTVNFTAPANVIAGSTYSLVYGGTTYGTATYPATTIVASGLTSNTLYKFNLTATNVNGTSIPTFAISAFTKINPPTIGSASSITGTSAMIGLTAPPGAAIGTTYNAIAGGTSYGTAAYPDLSANVFGLSPNTIYSFSLTATNANGTSQNSSTISITTLPPPPTNLIATAISDTAMSVAFTAPSGTATITSYSVTRSPGNVTVSGTSSPIIVVGLSANTSYTFIMTATNVQGTSNNSIASIPVTTNSVPNPPTNLAVVSTTSGSVTISFSPPIGTVSGYIASTSTGAQGTSTGSPITISGLGGPGTYTISIVSVNISGTSVPSNTIIVSTPNASANVSGGTVTTNGNYTVRTFTTNGTLTIVNGITNIYVLAVGGGGGGGADTGGGGGAGGVLYSANFPISSGSYPITIGQGGSGGTGSNNGSNGGNTTFSTLTAIGGGGGGGARCASALLQGGSGGGGSAVSTFPSNAAGLGTSGQGYAGGAGLGGYSYGSGGGGAGGVGSSYTTSAGLASAKGGPGITVSSVSGNPYYIPGFTSITNSAGTTGIVSFGGGGGGGTFSGGSPQSSGGIGGGGAGVGGSTITVSPTGVPNTGGGGGGGGNSGAYSGTGGSGIVIISYLTASGSASTTNTGVLLQPVIGPINTTATSILVNFTAPVGAASGTTYSIVYGGTTYGTSSYPATSVSASGLISNTQYTFYLTATNINGTSIPTVPITITTLLPAPTITSVQSVGTTTAVISFTAPTGAAVGTTYSAVAGGTTYGTSNYPANTINITGLSPNTTYSLNMFAFNAIGKSPASNALSITTVPTPPSNVFLGIASDTVINVGFNTTAGTAPITSYTAISRPGNYTYTGTSSPIFATGLTPNTAYSFTVTATNSQGTSAPSVLINPSVTNMVPNNPTNPNVVNITPNSVTVTFTPPVGTVLSYIATTTSGLYGYSLTSPMTIGQLTPNTTYTATISSVGSLGTSSPSVSFTITTPSATNVSTISTFDPKTVSGIILWLDATDPYNNSTSPINGTLVNTWYDKSGGGHNGTSSSGVIYNTTGFNNLPAFTISNKFTTADFFTGSVSNTNATMTIFAVCLMSSSSTGSGRVIGFSSGAGVNDYNNVGFMGFLRQNGTGMGPYRNGAYVNNNPPSYGMPYLWECWYDGSNEYATVQIGNSSAINNTASSGNFSFTYYCIGSNPNTADGNGPITGYISEILVYNTCLSLSDRQKIEGYLSWKWGLSANLPSSHLYYSGTISAPTISTISNITATSAIINFTAPLGASIGTVYSAISGSTNYGSSSYPSTSIFVNGLLSNTSYIFSLTTSNNFGTSIASPTITVVTLPQKITNITKISVSSYSVTVSFTASSGTIPITYSSTVGTGSGGPSAYVISGLSSSTAYSISIIATNTSGSVTSIPLIFTTGPVAPVNLSASSVTTTGATIDFTGMNATIFTLYAASQLIGSINYPSTTFVLAGLTPNMLYPFTITSTNSNGTSAPSNILYVTTLPIAPSSITLIGASDTTLSMSFPASEGNASIAYYASIGVSLGTYNNFTISGLSPNTTYTFNIIAMNSAGTTISQDFTATTVLSAPTGLTFVSSSENTATFSFTGSVGASNGTSYNIISGGTTYGTASYPLTTIVASGLTSNTAYTFSLTATNVNGTSLPSTTIPANTLPNPPMSIVASTISDTAASVAFTYPTGTLPISTYTVTSSPGSVTTVGSSSPVTIVGLAGSTSYTFNVKATNAQGVSVASSESNSITTNSSPNPPTNVTFVSATISSITVSFTPPVGVVTNYIASTSTGITGTSISSPITITGLAKGVTYTISVKSVDPYATSIESSSISVTTTIGTSIIDKLSTPGYNSCKGAYGCVLVNINYTGPILKLRASGGTGASSDFYSDTSGNLTTSSTGIGTSLTNWLSGQGASVIYAFVSIWYDQSVTNSNNGVQPTIGSQPIYDVQNKIMNFGYNGGGFTAPQSNCYLNLPDGTVPIGNTSYMVTFKHLYSSSTSGGWLGSGTNGAGSQTNNFRYNGTSYLNYWWGNDMVTGTVVANNVVTFKYDNSTTTTTSYINTTQISTQNRGGRNGTAIMNRIGVTTNNEYYNGQMYYLYIFSSPLVDADRLIVEATPNPIATSIITASLAINLDSSVGISGSNWTDQTGNGYNYAFYNSSNAIINYTTTTINGYQAISLNGTNYLWRNNASGFGTNFLSSFTYEMWVYPKTVANATLIYENGQNSFGGWCDDQMGTNSSGYLTSYVYSGGAITGTTGGTYVINKWYQVVNVYDNTAKILYQYVNGVLTKQVSISKSYPGTVWLVLGSQAGNGGNYMNGLGYFNGYIGAFRGYNIALSAAQVLQNYNTYKMDRYY
jgi:chitodextrinase